MIMVIGYDTDLRLRVNCRGLTITVRGLYTSLVMLIQSFPPPLKLKAFFKFWKHEQSLYYALCLSAQVSVCDLSVKWNP